MTKKSMTKFTIISLPRSGTNLLCGLLNSNPEVHCDLEIFNWGSPISYKTGVRRRKWYKEPEKSLEKYWHVRGSGVEACGFKILDFQCPKAMSHIIENENILKIVLERKNYIKNYYSYCSAIKYGFYTKKMGPIARYKHLLRTIYTLFVIGQFKKAKDYTFYLLRSLIYTRPSFKVRKLEIDFEEMHSYITKKMKFMKDTKEKLDHSNQKYLYITYEDLTGNNREKVYSEIQDFLGVQNHCLQPRTEKLHPQPLADLITNLQEIKKQLEGTELECMLD